MTTDLSNMSLNRAGNKRGLHPNCRKNLNPAKPGENRFKHTGYSMTSRLKEALRHPIERPSNDAPAGDHIVYATLLGAKELIPVAFRETWDRAEGKQQDTPPAGYQDNRVINIVVSSEKAKELTQGVADRFRQATKE